MKTLTSKIAATYAAAGRKASAFLHAHSTALMLVAGSGLLSPGWAGVSHAQSGGVSIGVGFGGGGGLSGGFQEPGYDDTLVRGSVGLLFQLIEGAFGALVMVVAGLGAIIAAAMGAYRAALGMLVVAVGAFILRSLVSLFFGTNFDSPSA